MFVFSEYIVFYVGVIMNKTDTATSQPKLQNEHQPTNVTINVAMIECVCISWNQ